MSPNIRAATFARTTVTKCFGLFISDTVRSFFCAADSTVSSRRIAGSAPESSHHHPLKFVTGRIVLGVGVEKPTDVDRLLERGQDGEVDSRVVVSLEQHGDATIGKPSDV